MAIETTQHYTCDRCRDEIEGGTVYVDAMVYGAIFHVGCFKAMSASVFARALGLDDITLNRVGDSERGDKVIYAPMFKEVGGRI